MFTNKYFIAFAFVMFLAGCAASEPAPCPTPAPDNNAETRPAAPVPQEPDVRKMNFEPLDFKITKPDSFTLKNGIRVFYLFDEELPLVSATAMVRLGSVYDPEGKAGAANMLATMMRFGGTESYAPAEVDSELEFVCAEMSVECGRESGTAKLVVTKKDFDLGLKIFYETVAKPRLDAERMKLVAGQLAFGAMRKLQDPETAAGFAARALLYGKHPYGTNHEGLPQTIKQITREDLVEMHSKFLSPENIVLAVSGDIKREELEKKLNETFGTVEKTKTPYPPVPTLDNPDKSQVRLAFNPTISQTTIMMVSSGHKRHDPDRMKCVMLAFLLSKRLNEEVRDKRGYAYSIWSYFNAFDEGGMFAAVTQTKPKSTADAIRIMKNEIARMMNEPVGDKELSEARDSIINGFAFNFQSKLGICEMSASFDFFKFPENYIEQYYNEMSAMTAAQIQECAKKFLKPDKLRIVVVGNKEQLSEPLSTFSEDYKEAQWQQGTPPKFDISEAPVEKKPEAANKTPEKYPETPGEALKRFAECGEKSDADGAVEMLSDESVKNIADMMRSSGHAWGSLGLPDSDKNNDRKIAVAYFTKTMQEGRDIEKATKENFAVEIIEEKIDGDKATVTAKTPKHPEKFEMPLIKENGKWKIHLPQQK